MPRSREAGPGPEIQRAQTAPVELDLPQQESLNEATPQESEGVVDAAVQTKEIPLTDTQITAAEALKQRIAEAANRRKSSKPPKNTGPIPALQEALKAKEAHAKDPAIQERIAKIERVFEEEQDNKITPDSETRAYVIDEDADNSKDTKAIARKLRKENLQARKAASQTPEQPSPSQEIDYKKAFLGGTREVVSAQSESQEAAQTIESQQDAPVEATFQMPAEEVLKQAEEPETAKTQVMSNEEARELVDNEDSVRDRLSALDKELDDDPEPYINQRSVKTDEFITRLRSRAESRKKKSEAFVGTEVTAVDMTPEEREAAAERLARIREQLRVRMEGNPLYKDLAKEKSLAEIINPQHLEVLAVSAKTEGALKESAKKEKGFFAGLKRVLTRVSGAVTEVQATLQAQREFTQKKKLQQLTEQRALRASQEAEQISQVAIEARQEMDAVQAAAKREAVRSVVDHRLQDADWVEQTKKDYPEWWAKINKAKETIDAIDVITNADTEIVPREKKDDSAAA